ncbi:MAG: gamma-glutamyltransferase [Isosphaeraceae bacterium]|nr:gamma-glutamyltransferase [Isosphaeraceae bacterium]
MPGPPAKTGRGRALVVSRNHAAAEAGAAILRAGGNAFDAAVAAGFVEAVISPNNCGIGGYGAAGTGFLAKAGKLVSLDADAVAPAAAKPDLFPTIPTPDPNSYKLPDDRHRKGPLSVAVPGVLGGLLMMLETWGRLPRQAVMAPAIRWAREGVTLTAGQAATWFAMRAEAEGRAAPTRPAGPTRVAMPLLADTLEAIAAEGAEVFYAGRIGRAIADHLQKIGGILTREDMAAYQARIVEPVAIEFRGRRLATTPPPSGGLTSLQIIALIDRLDRNGRAGTLGHPERFEAFLETLKVVWEDRLTTLADPQAMERPPASYLSAEHLDRLFERVQAGLDHPGPGRVVAPDPLRGTVHLAAADAEGNLVAWTQTHGGGFGSGVMVPGTEIVLGHGMCRFEPRPGWPNSVGPGKRPLHNMAPLLVIQNGRAALAAGASGGRTIINNVAAIVLATLLDGRDAAGALEAPRLQCETIEPAIVERSAGAECLAALRRRHRITEANRDAGVAHLILQGIDGWSAAAEPRADGAGVVMA